MRDSDRILGLLSSKTRRAELGNGPVKQHLLLTRYNPDRVADGDMMGVDDVKEILGIDVLGVIPESQDVLTASNAGVPVILDDVSPAGQAYEDAVARLARRDASDALHRSAKEGLPCPHFRELIDGYSGFFPFASEEHRLGRQGAAAHHRRAGTRRARSRPIICRCCVASCSK